MRYFLHLNLVNDVNILSINHVLDDCCTFLGCISWSNPYYETLTSLEFLIAVVVVHLSNSSLDDVSLILTLYILTCHYHVVH